MMILALSTGMIMAQTYTYPVQGKQGFAVTEKTRDGLHISYQLGQFTLDQLDYRGEAMSEITISGVVLPNTAGSPNLPTESRMMAIPTGAKATLNVVHYDTEVLHNVNIAPALRIQAETEEPDMEYKKDMKVYSQNAFYPENPFVMGESYIRGVDAITVAITPFQYNPVTKDLKVYTNIELSVSYEGGNGHFGEDRLRSPYWDPILAAELMNYDQLPVIDYEARMQQWLRDGAEGAEYLIITPNNDAWAPYAQQLKEFRMKQGILTEVYRLDQMPASTTDAMKTWFHNAYHNWDIPPVAVCLLGDHGTNMNQYIPAEEVYHSSYYGNCITDNRYADAQGGDNLPDMVFSRLVAQNATELPVFVSKQIDYESAPNTDASFYTSPITALGWQTERWFQICSEVFGGYMRNHGYTPQRINCIYQGTPGSVWSSNQNTSMVVNYFGPNGMNYIPASPEELGGWTGGTPEQVVQAINNGTFWLQHRDHGLEEGWGEPAVRNYHIDQMNNVGKLPFVMSINCQTGMFDYTGDGGTCFAEKWMRRTSNGQNAGAVGVLCPTDVSYSFVNDAFVWGVYDLFDGNFMPDYGPFQPAAPQTGNWRPAFGNVAGKYFLAQSSWPSNPDNKNITYTMFTAHCDAFLRIYTHVPQEMTVSHQDVQLAGLTTFQFTAPEGATIALTKGEGEDLEIVAVATATGSIQNIEIPAQVPPTVLRLTATGQNYFRYEANIEVIPAAGPYLVVNDYALAYEATQLNFGEDAGLNLELKNVGSEQAPAGTVTLTSESNYVTITNGTIEFEAVAPESTLNLSEAFAFTVSDEVPNKTNIPFTVTIVSGDDTYESHINLKAYAPEFEIGDVSFEEVTGNGNGRIDPGETIKLTFTIENMGNADSRAVDANLTMNNDVMIIMGEPSVTLDPIAAEGSETVEFTVYICGIPQNSSAEYVLDAVSGIYTATRRFQARIGLNVEDFESAQLDPTLWRNDVSSPWTITNQEPLEGNYCLKSGPIGNNAETSVILTYEVLEADNMSFWYKVSSENGYDKLFFYIDNVEKGNWSGNISWAEQQYAVTAGIHTFKWKYKKDSSQASGQDCCWIDFITLPHDNSMTASAGIDLATCEDNPVQVLGYAANYQSIQWTTAGDGTFSDATIANPVYTPGTQDVANGTVNLTMNVTGNGDPITDDITVSISHSVTITTPPSLLPMNYCAIEEPQDIAVEIEGDYTSFQWTTTGSGVFENANETITTYTPSTEDIEAGSVTLLATAVSEGCGEVVFEYAFEMNPLPHMDMPLPNCILTVCQGADFTLEFAEFTGFVNSTMTLEVNEETITLTEGQPLVLPMADLEPGDYTFMFNRLSNGYCDTEVDMSLVIQVLATPSLAVEETEFEICEGETVVVELTAAGGDPMGTYTLEGEGFEPITFTGASYTMEMTPAESTELRLTHIMAETTGCGDNCEADLDITVKVTVMPYAEVPEISGDNEVDVRLNPTSAYTIVNDVMAGFTLEPEEAGTLLPANDGKSVQITWSESYKGDVVLTATPSSICNNGDGTMTVSVKNSTGVDELSSNAKVYPNPTSEKVNIECTGMTHVTVFNTLGQMVYNAEVDTDKVVINTETMPAGSYVVRITTAEGSIAKHLNVIK